MSSLAPPLRSSSVPLPAGPRLHVVEQGDGTGPAVLLLHGWPDSWFSWSRVLPLLDPGLRVLAVDQRGFGDSDRPATGYTVDDLAADVAALCDVLGIGRVSLVGHSMGSFVARRVAELTPERVRRLVLVGSADRLGQPLVEEVRAAIADLADPIPQEFAREFQASTIHRPVPPEFFEGVVAASRKVPAHVYREVWEGLAALDDRADLARITAPTLLVWGDRDALSDRGQQDRLLALLADARVVVHPDTGHCPNWERPRELAAQLAEFLPRGSLFSRGG